MKPLPTTPALLAVAKRVVWFKEPSEALSAPVHFLSHVMTYGTPEDLRALHSVVDVTDFRDALEQAPAGVFDVRSWAYWNLRCGLSPPLPMPVRRGFHPVKPSQPTHAGAG